MPGAGLVTAAWPARCLLGRAPCGATVACCCVACARATLAASPLGLGLGLLLVRSQHHGHVAPVLLGRGLDEAEVGHVVSQSLQQPEAELCRPAATTTEHDRDLDLVAPSQEPDDVTLLGLVVVRVDLRSELHLLDDRVDLVLAGLARLHGRLVLELAEVHELGHGRAGVGATSTRSRSASWASRSASPMATMPTCSPLGPTSRTSGTRIRSLMRGSALMGPPRVAQPVRGTRKAPVHGVRESRWCPPATRRRRPDEPVNLRVGPAGMCPSGRCGWELAPLAHTWASAITSPVWSGRRDRAWPRSVDLRV